MRCDLVLALREQIHRRAVVADVQEAVVARCSRHLRRRRPIGQGACGARRRDACSGRTSRRIQNRGVSAIRQRGACSRHRRRRLAFFEGSDDVRIGHDVRSGHLELEARPPQHGAVRLDGLGGSRGREDVHFDRIAGCVALHAQHRVVEAVLVLVVGYVVTELERKIETQLFLRHGRHRDAPREHVAGMQGKGAVLRIDLVLARCIANDLGHGFERGDAAVFDQALGHFFDRHAHHALIAADGHLQAFRPDVDAGV